MGLLFPGEPDREATNGGSMTTHHRAVNMGSSSYGRPRTREPGHSEHAETGRDGTGYKIVACCRHAPS